MNKNQYTSNTSYFKAVRYRAYIKYTCVIAIISLSIFITANIINYWLNYSNVSNNVLFSPYKYVPIGFNNVNNIISTNVTGLQTPLTQIMNNITNFNTITLAFAIGNCNNESWRNVDGVTLARANIQNFVNSNINYIISTGGYNHTFTCNNSNDFINFINRYYSKNLIGIDFDIESGQTQNDINNIVQQIKDAQIIFSNLKFSFTVATLASLNTNHNLGSYGVMVMNSIKNIGLKQYSINLMSFDYGIANTYHCVLNSVNLCNMSASAIRSVQSFNTQYNISYSQIELTIKIGSNINNTEIFSISGVKSLTDFAKNNKLLGLHFWSFDIDTNCNNKIDLSQSDELMEDCNNIENLKALSYTQEFIKNL